MTLEQILRKALEAGATDVHLKAGALPVIRRFGTLRVMDMGSPALTGEEIEFMAFGLMDDVQRAHYAERGEIDLGYGVSGLGRFRLSVFKQRGTARVVVRNIPHNVPSLEDLNLPDVLQKVTTFERGLVLITGVAGSGKSSTLAAMIDEINRRESKHILTIEDPIEYLIRDRKSLITQREIGIDTISFASGLRAGLRQDPNVILIGEMRDRETIETALLAAETGHLILSTLHTLDATETINRILATFDSTQQMQVRLQLGATLKAVVSQRLARRKDGTGLVPAVEILVNNPRVRDMIEVPAKTSGIREAIEEGQAAWSMQSFDQSLMFLLNKELITFEEALLNSARPEDFRIRYAGISSLDGKKWSDGGRNHVNPSTGSTKIVPPHEAEIELMAVDNTKSGKRKKHGTGDK